MLPMRAAATLTALLVSAVAAAALDFSAPPPSVWELTLGHPARALPRDSFANFACGTGGGPPSRAIGTWTDFALCPADAATGLHDVYFEFDDELRYRALALRMDREAARFAYTSVYDIPVIASGLFNADGALMGLRFVSDPRVPDAVRENGYSLGTFILSRFSGGWSCTDTPQAEGESAYMDRYLNRRCDKTDAEAGQRYSVEQRFLRRRGQHAIDPVTNMPTEGQFESTARVEIMLLAAPDKAALDAVPAAAPPLDDALVARVRDCAGCDLAGAELKRADLKGANLAGADLSGANLHGADLSGADLSGARLIGANLDRALLRRANLDRAELTGAMAYEAQLQGASLRGALMRSFHAGHVQLVGADLSDAVVSDSDLVGARISNATLTGADFTRSGLGGAQLGRSRMAGARFNNASLAEAGLAGADLAGADLSGADLIRADLTGADLSAARFAGARLTSARLGETKREGASFDGAILPRDFRHN